MRFSVRVGLFFLAFFLAGLAQWIGASFDSPTLDQILYHLRYSEGMGIDVGRIFLWTFVMECVAFPLAFALAAAWLTRMVGAMPAGSAGNPRRLHYMVGAALPAVAVCCGAAAVMAKLSVFSWIGYHFAEDRFAARYVDAAQVQVTPAAGARPKNLVLIYMESVEETYGDASLWGRDLLKPLHDGPGFSFTDYRGATGANWTIAAMVATQCGVPLRVVSQYDIKEKPGAPAFLPGATCLGDVLHAQGYRNVFLGGAPLAFAGKGKFLRDHHYATTYGRDEWEKEGTTDGEVGEWGLFDDALYARAKAKLKALHDAGKPFNLTLLTLDTHNPHGFRSPMCRARGLKEFEDIVHCASVQATDFIRFIESSGYMKDTVVVVLGDHLAVSNPVYARLKDDTHRRVFNRFIAEGGSPPRNTQDILPFDLYPTILRFMGFEVAGGRLGLGYAALGTAPQGRPQDVLEDLALPALSGSSSYARLWDAP